MTQEEIKEKIDRISVGFGRWLLKYAEPVVDEEGFLCWNYGGGLFDTHELYTKFLVEEFTLEIF